MTFFFVLSGFVISWASRFGVKENYYKSRLARIYPAYIIMGIISLPFIFDYDPENIPVYIGIFLTMTQSLFTDSFSIWNFGGSWSVSTEMFFYMTFPLTFPLIKKNPVATLIISIIASSLIIPISFIISHSSAFPQYYISPIHRLPEFSAGVALGCLYASGIRMNKMKTTLLLLSLISIIFLSPYNNEGWTKNNYITLPATCIIIYFLACSKVQINKFTSPLIYLGKISYSFYLMQLPIVLFTVKYHDLFKAMPTWLIWLSLGFINLVLASLCYHLIEKNNPISRVFNQKMNAPETRKI